MNSQFLSNILATLSPDQGFGIYGDINSESDYNSGVIFNNPAHKPSWSDVQSGQNGEQWRVVRGKRNRKLSSCDWTMLSDVPISSENKSEWGIYRQALRDITTHSDPFNITWPTPPA